MNEPQIQSLLAAIAISSGLSPNITPSQRTSAFDALEQFKSYTGRIGGCVELIGRPSLSLDVETTSIDVTTPTKLFCLGLIQEFLKTGYSTLEEGDRIQLRTSILLSARQLATTDTSSLNASAEAELRILSMKVASLLADVAVREFPQRWNNFVNDLFSGIWGDGNVMGVKICLECLKLITEDCTDSDFNSKVRRHAF